MQKRTWLLVVLAPALAALVGGVGWCLAGGATASLVSGVAAYAVLAAAISWWLPGDGRSARAEGSGEVPAPSGTYTKPDGPPLQEIIDALPEGVAYFDADDRLVLCNERYRSFYSAAADMLVPGVSFESVVRACQKRGVYAGVTNDDADFLATRIMLHRKADFSHEQRLASGRWIQVQERPSSNGGTLGVWMDITEFKQREERLRRAALILEQVAEAVFVVDRDFVIRDCNPAGDRLLGVEHGQLIGASLADFFRAGERELLTHTIHAAIAHHARWDGELHFAREADEIITESVLVPLVENHGVSESLICVSRDVSERRAAEAQLDYVANYDPLTTLPNRLLFRDRLDQAMAGAAWNRQRLALMHIDLDGFQLINEGMGHDVGDRVLKMVADRLTGATRQGDTLARTGGDKYALIQTELPRVEQAAFRARHILDLLEPPLHLDGRELSISASLGVALYPEDGRASADLVRAADLSLSRAKSEGRNTYRFFVRGMDDETRVRCALEHDMTGALERNEFLFHYQPQVELATGRVVGCEALVRWAHPDYGLLYPDQFIPMAEESGAIIAIGEWGLREALRQFAEWRRAGHPVQRMAVNLSAVQFRYPNLVTMIDDVLRDTGVDPDALELEITESVALKNPDAAASTMARLNEIGVRFAIDDFGTGYSSLNYLKRFPAAALKVDRSLVSDLAASASDAAIISAVIGLGHSLDMTVFAEGIENDQQLDFLKAHDCDFGQGSSFSCALLPADFIAYLQSCGQQSLPLH